jgi:hypothetical protein
MSTNRTMTKSPLAVAREALAVAQAALPPYSSKFSRKDFTQHQLFALLALREFLKTDYRGLEQYLHDWSDLRQALGLSKVPDHSTLQKAAARLLEKKGPMPSSTRPSPEHGRVACSRPGRAAPSTRPATRPVTPAATTCGGKASGIAAGPGPS